jgi:hypothetical protein
MTDLCRDPSASSLSRKRIAEAVRDLAIERLVAAWQGYESNNEESPDLNVTLMELTEAQAAVDSGLRSRAQERQRAAIERVIAAWAGEDLDEITVAVDALAIGYCPATFRV